MEKYCCCDPFEIVFGTLEHNLPDFVKLLNCVYPSDKYKVELAEDGFVVIFEDSKKEELVSALRKMGWNIEKTGWVEKQVHPDAFLVIPERKTSAEEDDRFRFGGNPDFYPD
jgi:hypothetical protein